MEETSIEHTVRKLTDIRDTTFQNEDFNSFEAKVDEIHEIIKGLRSTNEREVVAGENRAKVFLSGGIANDETNVIDESKVKERNNRTVINQEAFDRFYEAENGVSMSQDAFMRSVEMDAQRRATERKERQELADTYKLCANKYFRQGKFEVALINYDKAIDQVRDSVLLYTNRALTLLSLSLYERVISDTDRALRLSENNLRAWLYKANALFKIKEISKAEECIEEAKKRHPQHKTFIEEYQAQYESGDNGRSEETRIY